MLQALPNSTAQRLVTRLSARALRSETWVKASEKPVGGDFQEDFRQIDTRHQVRHGRPQLQQRAGLVQLVQRPERQFGLASVFSLS